MTQHGHNNRRGGTQRDTVATLDDLHSLRREIHEELSGLRADLGGFQREISAVLSSSNRTNWTNVVAFVSVGLVIAGMAGALINSMLGAERLARQSATRNLEKDDMRDTARIDMLLNRELEDAFYRGESSQKFETIGADLHSAIQNRKDIDAKHVAAQERISKRIDELAHELDNGLGRRIAEILAPSTERIIALERQVYGDPPNVRDFDRK